MATIVVAHKPELTVEDTAEVFSRHFAGRYEVRFQHRPDRFVLRKNWWAELNISLEQRMDSTSISHTRKIPLLFLVLIVVSLPLFSLIGSVVVAVVGYILLRRNWRVMEDEVTSLLISAREFR